MLQKGSSFSLCLFGISVYGLILCVRGGIACEKQKEKIRRECPCLAFFLYLSPLRKGHLLNLKLGWHLASPRNPVSTALSTEVIGQQSNAQIFVGAEIQTHILICVQQVLFPTEPSPCPHLHSF